MNAGLNIPGDVQIVNDDGVWSVLMPGLPIAAEGTTREAAVADFIDGLREYAADWADHLHSAPNHAGCRALVETVQSSTDEHLAQWLLTARKL